MKDDGTAQGVAKVRHYESLLPPHQRLYHIRMPTQCFGGVQSSNGWDRGLSISYITWWFWVDSTRWYLSARNGWMIKSSMQYQQQATVAMEQPSSSWYLVGYDLRGFRLDELWTHNTDFTVIEVDQPNVQKKKIANLQWLIRKDANGQKIANQMNSKQVQFYRLISMSMICRRGFNPLRGIKLWRYHHYNGGRDTVHPHGKHSGYIEETKEYYWTGVNPIDNLRWWKMLFRARGWIAK